MSVASFIRVPGTTREVIVPASVLSYKNSRLATPEAPVRALISMHHFGTVCPVYLGGQDVDSTIGFAMVEDEVYEFELHDTDDLWFVRSSAGGGENAYVSVLLTGQFNFAEFPWT